ncbi:hypothetical protein K440DRAFT_661615 [Wilcoxina mikolae CBS 423.85]|nr:hypothetical protein K440DRAFT_661615 [Wilcoxina mikolae CBS 423.85]
MVGRAKERAGDKCAEFEAVYACLESIEEKSHYNGAEKRKTINNSTAQALVDRATRDLARRDMTWVDVAKEMEITGARSTLERIFHAHNIFRYKARIKPPLTMQVLQDRVRLGKLGLTIDICHIVFTDEMWVEFNSSRRQSHQTRSKGENVYEVARPRKDDAATIRIMFWSAINCLLGVGSGYIDPKSTSDDKKHQRKVQKEVNDQRQEQSCKHIHLAELPGTEEVKRVAQVNTGID